MQKTLNTLPVFQNHLVLNKKIVSHPDLSSSEKIFLGELQSLISTKPDKKLNYTLRMLSETFCVSHVTVKNWIKKLVHLEFVETGIDYPEFGSGSRKANHYLKIGKKAKELSK